MMKATKILSSSSEVLKQVDRQCSNKRGEDRHRHVQLVQGRARACQVYPRLFGERLCEGIAAQKKLDSLGLAARPLMTLEEMQQAAKQTAECPSSALHEPDCSGMTALDDVTGQQLDPKLMVQARKDEIQYFRQIGVYEKVDVAEALSLIHI